MSALALALVLSSALLHALWNALLKREPEVSTAAVLVLGVAAACAILLAPFWPGAAFPQRVGLYWALGAGLFEAGYFIALAMALLRAPLGLAYTVARGGAIALVWPISTLWLGERVTPWGLCGVVVLALGLLLLGSEGLSRAKSASGLRWSLLCATGIAGYHLCYKEALAAQASPAALFAVSLAIAWPLNWLWLDRAQRVQLRARLQRGAGLLVLAGVICTASFMVFLHALSLSGAGAVLTLRNTSVVFAQVFAFMLGETISKRQLLAAGLVALGAALLGLGA